MKHTFWTSGTRVERPELTDAQWEALERVADRWDLPDTVQIMPGIGYIMVDVGSMCLGIEEDGHTHS